MSYIRPVIADRLTGDPISLGASLVAGKKVVPDATLLLEQDHLTAMNYFDWYERAPDAPRKGRVAVRLCAMLRAHMIVEEEILYPAARDATGDPGLVERSVQEHADAKALIDRILPAVEGGGTPDDLMLQLRAAIAQHVAEEEGELFPKLRAAGLDLHELGARLAARRVELLFVLTGRDESELPETDMTPVSQDDARSLFVIGLKNAHATEMQCKAMVERQIDRIENYPKLLMRMEQHREENRMQIERIETILDSLGEDRSTLKDSAMAMMGNMSAMMHAAADDEIVKNSFANSAMAQFEVSSYEALITMGEAAGAVDAVRLLNQSLSEERGMAAWLAEHLRETVVMFMQLRTQGAQASH